MPPYRIAVITTHPIQYQVPWFRTLSKNPSLLLDVLFCHDATPTEQSAAGFGVEFDWDVPLLTGYRYRFLRNVATEPTISNFLGLDTPEVKQIIERRAYDAVIVNGWHYKSAWQTIVACWLSKTPVLVRGDSHLHVFRHPAKRSAKMVGYRLFVPRFDACLAVGTWSREYFLNYGASPERIFLVPHIIDDQRFLSTHERLVCTIPAIRQGWHINREDAVFLFVGKFIDKKRPMDFVHAIERAHSQGVPIVGLMVGNGPYLSVCQSYAAQHNIPIRFVGFLNQSEIVSAYTASDALVLPSDGGETWGLVANEAMMCGLPCFVSDQVGCGPDLVIPGRTGRIFPVGNIDALAELISFYGRQRHLLHEMGRNACEHVKTNSTNSAVKGVLDAVAAVTGEKSKVPR